MDVLAINTKNGLKSDRFQTHMALTEALVAILSVKVVFAGSKRHNQRLR